MHILIDHQSHHLMSVFNFDFKDMHVGAIFGGIFII